MGNIIVNMWHNMYVNANITIISVLLLFVSIVDDDAHNDDDVSNACLLDAVNDVSHGIDNEINESSWISSPFSEMK